MISFRLFVIKQNPKLNLEGLNTTAASLIYQTFLYEEQFLPKYLYRL